MSESLDCNWNSDALVLVAKVFGLLKERAWLV